MRSNYDIVKIAVNNDGLALKFAMGFLYDDYNIIFTAFKSNGHDILKYASRRLNGKFNYWWNKIWYMRNLDNITANLFKYSRSNRKKYK